MTTLHSRKSIDRSPLRRAEIHGLQKLMKTLTKVLLILLVSYFVAAANGASFDVFLKIEGIEGDSTDPGHLNEINVVSFNTGVRNSGSFAGGGGSGAGKTEFTDLTVFKYIDKASPQLFIAAANGDHIRRAMLVVRKSGPNPFTFYRIVLGDVLISSVNDNASITDQNGNLLESITLNWAGISWTFIPQNADGSRGEPISGWFDTKSVRGGSGTGPFSPF
jgi:type VI secretion system secreted protein Hcp